MAVIAYIFPLCSQWLIPAIHHETNSCHKETDNDSSIKNILQALYKGGHNEIIIAGPDRADKTSMVFQAAVTAASLGSRVVYICTHPLSRLPVPIHGMKSPEPTIMRNVDLLYFEDCKELVAWLASVQTKKKLPSFLVLEDVLAYASQLNEANTEVGLAKLCAIISNSCSWIKDHNETGKCSILMTAPARGASFENVFHQFGFKMAKYTGPSPDNNISNLSYTWGCGSLEVLFHKVKNSLMVKDLVASQITDT